MPSFVERVNPPIIFGLCVVAALGTTPFVISHIVSGNLFMLGITASVNLILVTVAWETWRTKQAPVRGLIAATVVGGVVVFLAGLHLKMPGILWAYPYIGFTYFFIGHRMANWVVAAFFPAVAIGAYHWTDSTMFPRIVVTLALTWLFSVVFAINNERQRAELARLAASDPLTGIGNRRAMYDELQRARDLYARHRTPASLIMLDIDHFKSINDCHGHHVGDDVLVDLARIFNERLRKTDRLFRAGGEEFVVLLPQTPLESALSLSDSLRELMAKSTLGGLQDVTISSGVAILNSNEDIDGWLKRADAALYRAKAQGRNRVEAAA